MAVAIAMQSGDIAPNCRGNEDALTTNPITTVLGFKKEVGSFFFQDACISPTGLAGTGTPWLVGNTVYFSFRPYCPAPAPGHFCHWSCLSQHIY